MLWPRRWLTGSRARPYADTLAVGCEAGLVEACDSGRCTGRASPTGGPSSEVSGWRETGLASGDSRFLPDSGADLVDPGGLTVVGGSSALGVTGSAVDAGSSAGASAGAAGETASGVAGMESAVGVVTVVTGAGESVSPPSGVPIAASVTASASTVLCVGFTVADGSTSTPGDAASGLEASSAGCCTVGSAASSDVDEAESAVIASVVSVERSCDEARASPALCADSAVAFGSASASFGACSGCNPSLTGWRNVGSVASSGVNGTGSVGAGLVVCSATVDGAGSAGTGAAGRATPGAGDSGSSGSGTGGGTLTRGGRNVMGST